MESQPACLRSGLPHRIIWSWRPPHDFTAAPPSTLYSSLRSSCVRILLQKWMLKDFLPGLYDEKECTLNAHLLGEPMSIDIPLPISFYSLGPNIRFCQVDDVLTTPKGKLLLSYVIIKQAVSDSDWFHLASLLYITKVPFCILRSSTVCMFVQLLTSYLDGNVYASLDLIGGDFITRVELLLE